MFKLLTSSIVSLLLSFNLATAVQLEESDSKFKTAADSVKLKEYKIAIDLFEELAENAEHDAQYNLAVLLRSGLGKPQDYKLALKWAWLAYLGEIDQANEVVKDLKKILPDNALTQVRANVSAFLKVRADNGDFSAIKQMGEYYLIVPEEPDYKLAYLWFLVASAFQIDGSVDKRNKVEKEIEPADIISVQAGASKLFGEISKSLENRVR